MIGQHRYHISHKMIFYVEVCSGPKCVNNFGVNNDNFEEIENNVCNLNRDNEDIDLLVIEKVWTLINLEPVIANQKRSDEEVSVLRESQN